MCSRSNASSSAETTRRHPSTTSCTSRRPDRSSSFRSDLYYRIRLPMDYGTWRNRLLGAVLGLTVLTAAHASADGIVVESVAKGSPAERAGLAVGDVLLSWERPAPLPAAGGELRSPFDLVRLERAEGPLGPLVFSGRRGDQAATFRLVTSEHWQLVARPSLPDETLSTYERAREALTTAGASEGARL